jgi:uncharacterized protein YjbI with pentapeptide repeats
VEAARECAPRTCGHPLPGTAALVCASTRVANGIRAERIQLGEHEHYVPAKTLWDWLQLFGAPVVLAVIVYFFQRATKTADQKLAIESQRHSILQAYFDSMSQLLASEEWERDVRAFRRYGMKDGRGVLQQMVRARTLMLLKTLNTDPPDQKRRGQVVRFLRETRLIQAGHLGTPALIDLSGADLRGVALERADLSQADLRGVDLRGADLRWANLKDIAEDIISPDARYRQPTVHTTKLDPKWQLVAGLLNRGGGFGKNLKGKDLSNAYLVGASLSHCDLGGVDLRSSFLNNCSLGSSDLSGADLTGAVLDGAELSGCKLDSRTRIDPKWKVVWRIASFQPANELMPLIAKADLSNAVLRFAHLPKAVFVSADLTNTIFEEATLSGAEFQKSAQLFSTDFRGAKLEGARFEAMAAMVNFSSADLSQAVFRKSNLFACNCESATFVEADLSEVSVEMGKFRAANLRGAKFIKARVSDTDLSDAILEEADLTGANLERVTLAGANLRNAVLKDAIVSEDELKKAALLEGVILPDGRTATK